ncbi:MAG TPA: hypothetical protein VNK48_05735 [Xanthobacteraceae bacterium]|nr:hypothetical protein [Xanthobacteraceae bacterium]
MILRALLRRRPPIHDLPTLAAFIDQNAAFVVQKGIYEYARARAGHYAKVLFREAGFLQAVEQARWRAYPLGLAMVAELVEGALTKQDSRQRRERLDALTDLVLGVFDRYPVPQALGVETWTEARAELARRLSLIGLHPPKWAKDIPESFARAYFELMPIHEQLRGADFFTIRNYLRVSMCNIHDELIRRMDIRAIEARLTPQPE